MTAPGSILHAWLALLVDWFAALGSILHAWLTLPVDWLTALGSILHAWLTLLVDWFAAPGSILATQVDSSGCLVDPRRGSSQPTRMRGLG